MSELYIGTQLCAVLFNPKADPALVNNAKELIQNPDTLWAVVSHRGDALQFANKHDRDNHMLVFAAVQNDGLALKYASHRLRKCEKIVMAAVKQNGLALQYAVRSYRSRKSVVLAALAQNQRAYEYVSRRLQSDADVLAAIGDPDSDCLSRCSLTSIEGLECRVFIAQKDTLGVQ